MCETDMIMRYIRIFSELSSDIRYAAQKRILTEIALIKLCRPQMENRDDTVLDRIRNLEEQVEKGIAYVPQINATSASDQVPAAAEKAKLPDALPEDIQNVVNRWRQIVGNFEGLDKNLMTKVSVSLSADNKLLILIPCDEPACDRLLNDQVKENIKRIISDSIDKEIEIEVQKAGNKAEIDSIYPDILKMAGINTNIIEED